MHSIPETRIEVDAPRDIGGSILATIYTARIRNTDANSSFSSRMETASAGKAFSRYVSAFIAQRFDSSLFFLFLQRRTRSIYSRNLSIGDDQFQILFPFLASSRFEIGKLFSPLVSFDGKLKLFQRIEQIRVWFQIRSRENRVEI